MKPPTIDKKHRWLDRLLLVIFFGGLAVAAFGIYQYVTQPHGLVVRWSTENELDVLGFNLYRASCESLTPCSPIDSAYQKLNAQPIPANADPVAAADYEYVDAVAESGSFAYLIETLYLSGDVVRSDQPIILTAP